MSGRYCTVEDEGFCETVEKKSRFLASVSPVSGEAEALAYINCLKKKYWNATHNVFAYRVGVASVTERQSDDGEPGGTAGMPVLDVLRGQKLCNVVAVVTRYFGGTLLGTGGLVRAYGHAAAGGVAAAGVITMASYLPVAVTLSYSDAGKLQYAAKEQGHVVADTVYADTVRMSLFVEPALWPGFSAVVKDITRGLAKTETSPVVYGYLKDGGLVLDRNDSESDFQADSLYQEEQDERLYP